MARVYSAWQRSTGEKVALKVLPPELASATNGERFQREIGITRRLQHPHILPLLDSGVAGRLYWYAMPLVEGESLRGRLREEGPFELGAMLEVAEQVGAAIGHAHSHGVVHRDLKPENVMRQEGRWVVLDFGLARAIESDGRLTGFNMPLGTPAYMSPEQIMGAATVDARADIYGFGCLLYELVTGRPPFLGTTIVQLLRSHVDEQPKPPSAARPSMPAAADGVLLKALAKSPAARYQTAGELIEDLKGSLGRPRSRSSGLLGRLFGR
jgi:serine/threonine-protein kinase